MIQKLKTTTILKEWLETINLIIDSKVDKVDGKALSTNDFTNELKTKLESIITATADTEGLVKLSDSITSESGVAGGYAATPLAVNYAYKLAEEAKAIAEQAKTLGISAYKYVGSVATENDLPTEENEVGNVYNVEETGMNYAWNGSEWDSLGASIITVDNIVQADSNNPVSSDAVYNAINSIFESEAVFTAGVKTNTLTVENDIVLSNNESTPIIRLEHQYNSTEIRPAYMIMADGNSTLTISPTTIEFNNGNSISESESGAGLYIPTLEVGTLYTEDGIDGNAATATKLETPITITIDGDASGSVSFDGSEDVTIEVEIADDSHNHTIDTIENLQNLLDEKAPINSPEFTGVPTAPTASSETSSTQIATTAFVQALVIDSDVMIYKGNIPSPNELPVSPSTGDVYRVDTENTNYVWSGTEWTAIGQTITVDDSVLENSVNPVTGGAVYTEISNLSTIYATKEELEDAIPENVNGDEYITEMTATYPENTIITLNGFEYPTGIKAIRVSLDGFVLSEGIHYEEVIVSSTSTYSNKIKLLIPSEEGMVFHVWLSPISLSVGILEDKIQIAENSASMATEAITEITDLTNRAEIAADRAEAASGASAPMVGATDTKNGVQGLVPQPLAGEHLKFLRGDGTWQTIQMESEGLSGDTYLWVASENYSEGTIINLEDFSYPHSKNAILVSLDGFLLNEGREYEEVISDESSPVSNQIKFKFDIEPDMVIRIWVAPLEAKISNFDAKIAEANNYALQSKEYYELTKEYAAEAMNLFGTVATIENNTIDVSISSFFKKTITTDTSFEFINCKADSSCCVTLVLTNGGNHIVSWSNNVYWADGTPAILTENGIDVITFFTINGGNTWYATVTITNAQSIL